ncbi:hypothetical protein FJY70_01905 [candidate division WOR-3 bacterium]|nr:hypothetical protein [candidate division WOR-3 bacterium]
MEASIVSVTPDSVTRANAKAMSGWMKFIGIMTIIGGALNAISIIGLLWAWLPIWLGVVLTQAGAKAQEYAGKGDAASLEALTGRLKTYFVLSGIVLIASLVVGILVAVGWLVLLATGVLSSSSLMDYINRYR